MSTHRWLKQEPVDQDDQVPDSAHSEYGQHTSSYGYSPPAIPRKVQIEMNLDMLANEEKTRSKKSSALRVGNSNNSGRPVIKTKMKRCAQDCSDDDEISHQHHRKRPMKGTKDSNTPLACPFAKHDPIASPGCWDFAAENLARLKEHLLRRHERPYCPICFDSFENYDARDSHVRERECDEVDGKQRGPWMEPDVTLKIRRRTRKGENVTQDTEDIGRLYMERIRKTVADDFIQHVHATLDLLSTDGIANKPSAIKAACISHLSKVADQYVTRGESKSRI
ncbi:unnamed protein product [Alternaria alternata]